MMQLRLGFAFALSAMGLVGCSSLGITNHSLNYKDTTTLEPLEFPTDATVRPFTPLYPAPTVDPLAIENAPKFENKRGNRFALPRPEQVQNNTAATTEDAANVQLSRPQLVVDGNKNPLLRIEGPSETIWQYTLATLSSLNYEVVGQSKNRNEATIKVGDQVYQLKLTSVGSSHNLAVFNADNSFADREKAAEVLAQIYQNWPA